MPVGVVKTAKDEKRWDECKASARAKGLEEGTPRFYRYTMGCMKARQGNAKAKREAIRRRSSR